MSLSLSLPLFLILSPLIYSLASHSRCFLIPKSRARPVLTPRSFGIYVFARATRIYIIDESGPRSDGSQHIAISLGTLTSINHIADECRASAKTSPDVRHVLLQCFYTPECAHSSGYFRGEKKEERESTHPCARPRLYK